MRLKTKQVASWITMEDVDGNKCRFLVVPLTPKQVNTMLNNATESEWDKGQRFESLNGVKYRTNKLIKAIQDWEGVEDEDGNELECNDKNKEILYLNNPGFTDALIAKIDAIYEFQLKKDEEDTKNLPNGPDGTLSRE